MKKILLMTLVIGTWANISHAQLPANYCDIPPSEQQAICNAANPCRTGQICAGSPVMPPPGQPINTDGTCVKFDPSNPKDIGQCIPASAQGPAGNPSNNQKKEKAQQT